MKIQGKSVLVTGGAGFIGSHLVDELIKYKPSQIIVVDNFFLGKEKVMNLKSAKSNFPELSIIEETATDIYNMDRIISTNNVDVVFNLAVIPLVASLIKPSWVFDENVKMTLALCDLLKDGKYQHLVQYSSSEAYGTMVMDPMTETHPINPETPYAASKLATDLLALSYWRTFKSEVSVIRPFNNYGPRQNEGNYAGVIPITINNLLMGGKPIIHSDGLQTRDYIYVEDTARLTLDLVESGKILGKIVNVAVGQEISVKKIINTIVKYMDFKGEIVYEERRIGDVDQHRASIDLLKSTLGEVKFTPFEVGIQKTIEYYQENFEKMKEVKRFYDLVSMEKLLSNRIS
ncbi:MAG: NAD-dependent epimerase/dehydratase family protein [Candidatus Hodarchaeales archaeon]|jgi:UDP-glucose 4-epimerase